MLAVNLSRRALSVLIVLGVFVGVSFYHVTFTKLEPVTGLYVSEFCFLLWLVCAFPDFQRIRFTRYRSMLPLLAFVLWGCTRFAIELLEGNAGRYSWIFSLQQMVVYIYPFCWGLVGLWLGQGRNQRVAEAATVAVLLAASAPALLSASLPHNISIGPLVAVAYFYFLFFVMPRPSSEVSFKGLVFVALFLLSYLPFWRMWMDAMQRTSLLLFLAALIGLALWAWLRKSDSFGRSMCKLFASAAILVFGFLSISFLLPTNLRELIQGSKSRTEIYLLEGSEGAKDTLRKDFLGAFQKGEDIPLGPGQGTFQGRFRLFMAEEAIRQWRISPLIGIGFKEIVPEFWIPEQKNAERKAGVISGPHNSYLLVLARTGMFGAVLLLLAIGAFAVRWWKLAMGWREPNYLLAISLFIPFAGFFHAIFNIGLESPQNCLLLWVFFGYVTALSYERDDEVA